MSGSSRREICCFGFSNGGRPIRGGLETRSGSTSRAGRARANIALVHAGLSLSRGVRFCILIALALFPACKPQTDDAHHSGSTRINEGMQRGADKAQCNPSPLAILAARVVNDDGARPLESFGSGEIDAVLFNVGPALRLIPGQPHELMYHE